jgi:hypothetical protein
MSAEKSLPSFEMQGLSPPRFSLTPAVRRSCWFRTCSLAANQSLVAALTLMLAPPSKLVEHVITRSDCIRHIRLHRRNLLSAATNFQYRALPTARAQGKDIRSTISSLCSPVSLRLCSFQAPLHSASTLARSKKFAPVRTPLRSTFVRYCSTRRNMCKLHAGAEVAEGGLNVSKGREILPANVRPTNYGLTLEPNFEKLTYEGRVTIE